MSAQDDIILPFQVGDTTIRGRLVRLGPAVDEILSRHKFNDPLSMLLGETAALVSMLGAALKFDGKLILQLQGDGPVSMVVADYTVGGALRATASVVADHEWSVDDAKGPELHFLLRKGTMAMTIDQGKDMERYQGVTPLEGATLSEGAVNYFAQSEQIPTAIKLAIGKVSLPGEEPVWRAGGIMVQFMPGEGGTRERGEAELLRETDQDDWDNASAKLNTTQLDELLDPTLTPEELLYRLYHEDKVRVFDTLPVHFECTCAREKVAAVLEQYTQDQLDEIAEDGKIEVTCDFCREAYEFEVS